MDVKPRLHLFGHIHAQHGITTKHGITFSNGAIMNADYNNHNTLNTLKSMNTKEQKSIVSELEESPIFQLSLSSKELFHSNFLYWIWKFKAAAFKKIMEKLCNEGAEFDWSDDYIVERETKNFDLSVWEKNGNKEILRLIIENKVKSIPRIKQLDKYKKVSESIPNKHVKFLLLSLSTNFPEKEEISASGWNIVNYKELAEAIEKVVPYNCMKYEDNLIRDYCNFIKKLHSMVSEWSINAETSWLDILDKDKYSQLRINDIRLKLYAAYALSYLLEELSSKKEGKILVEWEIPAKDIMNKSNDNTFYVNFGMTNATGFFEIKVKIEDKTIFLIQVQGNQYRRAIEREAKYDENIAWLRDDPQSPLHRFFADSEGGSPEFKYQSPLESESPFRPKKEKKQNGFCKYGDWFVYQYVKLDENVKIKDIINAAIADIEEALRIKP